MGIYEISRKFPIWANGYNEDTEFEWNVRGEPPFVQKGFIFIFRGFSYGLGGSLSILSCTNWTSMSVCSVPNYCLPFIIAISTSPPNLFATLGKKLIWHIWGVFFNVPFLCQFWKEGLKVVCTNLRYTATAAGTSYTFTSVVG